MPRASHTLRRASSHTPRPCRPPRLYRHPRIPCREDFRSMALRDGGGVVGIKRYELGGAQWHRIEPMLAAEASDPGRTAAATRRFINGVRGGCDPGRVGRICLSAMATTGRCTSGSPAGCALGCGSASSVCSPVIASLGRQYGSERPDRKAPKPQQNGYNGTKSASRRAAAGPADARCWTAGRAHSRARPDPIPSARQANDWSSGSVGRSTA